MATDYELKILDPVTGGTVTQLFDTINSNSKEIEDHALKDGAITTAQLENGAVTTAKINDNAVTTAKINNGAITSNKLNDDITNTMIDMLFPIGAYYWSSVDLSHNESGSRGPLDHGTWTPVEGKMLFAAGRVQEVVSDGTLYLDLDKTFSVGDHGGTMCVNFRYNYNGDDDPMFHSTSPNVGVTTNYTGYNGRSVLRRGSNGDNKPYVGLYQDNLGQTHLTAPSNMPPYEVAYCWHRTG